MVSTVGVEDQGRGPGSVTVQDSLTSPPGPRSYGVRWIWVELHRPFTDELLSECCVEIGLVVAAPSSRCMLLYTFSSVSMT